MSVKFLITMLSLILSVTAMGQEDSEPWSPDGFGAPDELQMPAGAKARVGTDTREDADVSVYPYRSIGRIFFTTGNGGRSACTGTLVAENIVLTNGHCVVDKRNGRLFTDIKFYPGYHDGAADIGYSTVEKVSYSNGYVDGTSGSDWAFLVLTRPLGRTLGWMGVKKYSSTWNGKKMFNLAGYGTNSDEHPFSGRWQTRNTVKCEVDRIVYADRALFHDCDSGQGNSGSALFSWFDGKPYAVGVNYGGFGPRGDDRMESCEGLSWGRCGNVAARADKFLSTLNRLRDENRP